MTLTQLRRIRWAVRAVLMLGVAASIAGNVLHASGGIISQIISAWSPLALLLTIELISRVPVHRRGLAFARWAATALIAGIAAWVSYWHMAGVAARYGETGASPYLLPLSVDGLIVVASVCLVELGGRIADVNAAPAATPEPAKAHTPSSDSLTAVVDATTPATVAATAVATHTPPRPAKRTPTKTATGRQSNRELVAATVAKKPAMTQADVARLLGLGERTVQRYWPKPAAVATVNGHHHGEA